MWFPMTDNEYEEYLEAMDREEEEEEEDLYYYDDEEEEDVCEEEIAEAEIRPTRPLKSCREIMEEYGMTIASLNREDAEYTFSLTLKGV